MTTARFVIGLDEIDLATIAIVGGKGASLGELARIPGVRVPRGFCVTTAAFRRNGPVPVEVAAAIRESVASLGGDSVTYAVRSSATSEDAPGTSFAGLHDTYLDVAAVDVVEHVARCWASLDSDRATAYRRQHGLDDALMAVVVQEMVRADVSGVMFTADPVTSHRAVVSIEATRGLGDALVSGRVTPTRYQVRRDTLAEQTGDSLLSAPQVRTLARLGRLIEAHFGAPQDIEWCLVGDAIFIVQSRPITTLFPVPVRTDDALHVYVSVGHQQMMTDAMKPLGLSLFQRTALRPMFEAGSRLFVDVTEALAAPASRAAMLAGFGKTDPLLRDALQYLVVRGDVGASAPAGPTAPATPPPDAPPPAPALVTQLIARTEESLAMLRRDIAMASGVALFDVILADIQELKRLLVDPQTQQALMAGFEATWWLDEHLEAWLGERSAAGTLAQSAPGNVTSEMGLALLDVADAIRPYPDVVTLLRTTTTDALLAGLSAVPGGTVARDAIDTFLDRYGMRCVGEIDITRPRWSERPSTLFPILLANIDHFEHGAGARRFADGEQRAHARRTEILDRLRALPDGEHKAAQTAQKIDTLRAFVGYREHPKYGIVCRYAIYKHALLHEADALVRAGVLRDREDAFYLTFDELRAAVATRQVDTGLVRHRQETFRAHAALVPPRVLTSDGEVIAASFARDGIPDGALVGLAVSTGIVEGRARILTDIATADLERGDILVTTYTDPSWTPAFVVVAGLVTEVGGQMTHGAVIAREYGLPAVVGVEGATVRIRDGQRIRVNALAGFVELLD